MKVEQLRGKLLWFVFLFILVECREDFELINTNKYESSRKNPQYLFNNALKKLAIMLSSSNRSTDIAHDIISTEVGYLLWVDTQEKGWGFESGQLSNRAHNLCANFYGVARCLKAVIEANLQAVQKNENQINIARIMLAYTFDLMLGIWKGIDIPYYSYGNTSGEFQALDDGERYPNPKPTKEEDIYKDLLYVLEDAVSQLKLNVKNKVVFPGGFIYEQGSIKSWIKFANSLCLRIASRKKDTLTQAAKAINRLKGDKENLILQNSDNAKFSFGKETKTSSELNSVLLNGFPIKVNNILVELLKGGQTSEVQNPFIGVIDPRLFYYAAPVEIEINGSKNTPDPSSNDEYLTYVLEEYDSDKASLLSRYRGARPQDNDTALAYCKPGYQVSKPDAEVYFISAAEINFLLAEDGDGGAYEEGIRCSMEQWKVSPKLITEYLSNDQVKSLNPFKLAIQMYIALYNQPFEAWAWVRRKEEFFGFKELIRNLKYPPSTLLRPVSE